MKDFFDEEFDKKTDEQQQSTSSQGANGWYSKPAEAQPQSRRPMYITLVCIGMVMCLVLGWVLCGVASSLGSSDADLAGDMFADVIKYLNQYCLYDLSDKDSWSAIEAAGTAYLQSMGDRYCQLMSPQTVYDFLVGDYEVDDEPTENFGADLYIAEGIGLYVGDVYTDGNAYGHAQYGDYVYYMSNIVANPNVDAANKFDFPEDGNLVLSELNSKQLVKVARSLQSATFHALRGGEVVSYPMERGYYYGLDKYNYIEYYFGPDNTNLHTTKQGKAATCSFDERKLNLLPDETGYIRITQFMGLVGDEWEETVTLNNAYSEFVEVMEEFKSLNLKHLVLDLKGNPGGYVDLACAIAGMLAKDDKGSTRLLMTTLEPRKGNIDYYYANSGYDYYFGNTNGNIVVWTDGNSASASELVTGALTDYGTAVQMGTKSFGKGIAQRMRTLPYSGYVIVDYDENDQPIYEQYPWVIYYTDSYYYSPVTHTNIHGFGYVPKDPYNGLTTYEQLWTAARRYWGVE